jgi:hypothetical protein
MCKKFIQLESFALGQIHPCAWITFNSGSMFGLWAHVQATLLSRTMVYNIDYTSQIWEFIQGESMVKYTI